MTKKQNTPKKIPTVDILEKLLEYCQDTGKLTWKKRPRDMFSTQRAYAWWNARYSNKEAFTSVDASGYKHGRIFDSRYLAHRVIWKMVNGEEPENIDHINGKRTDNRLSNLRAVSVAMNRCNAAMRSDNTSGMTGVSKAQGVGRWRGRVGDKHLGTFGSKEEAHEAVLAYRLRLGYHENHGRKAVS